MALATRLSAKSDSGAVLIDQDQGSSRFFTAITNGADIFLTAGITRQNETNSEDIDLAALGERVDGIVVGGAWPFSVDMSKDSDSPYADGKTVRCYKPVSGNRLYGTVKTNSAITQDAYVKFDGGFLVTAARADAVGKALEAASAVSATETIIAYEWGVN